MNQKNRKPLLISLPENYDIGYLPINQNSVIDFVIENPNDKPINYLWKYTIFQVTPPNGVLLPSSKAKFEINFKPEEATVVVATIILEADDEPPRIFKLSAIGKYSYVSCNMDTVDFTDVLVTKKTTKQIVLKNSSQVAAKFKITNSTVSDLKDNYYTYTPTEGEVPAKSSFVVQINYQPQIVNVTNINRLKIECEGGNNLKINCNGSSSTFDVKFSTKSINFGEIKLDSVISRPLSIYNNSQLQTSYQFFTDSGNIFTISEPKGILQRNSYKKIIIEFHPRNTVCYYQRIYCIVRNHHLLYVDLMGTCYDLLIKPLPLLQVHVDLFRRRVIEGRLSEIDIKYLQNNILMKIQKKMQLLKDQKNLTSQQFDVPEITLPQSELSLHKQLFLQGPNNKLIQISEDFIDFGYCQNMTISGQKEIQITNKMNCKITIYWILQKRQNFNGEYMTVFQVFPETQTLKANSTARFNITFRPIKNSYYFYQDLQFFALKENPKLTKKTLEDYQKQEMKTLRPEVTLLKTLKVSQSIQAKVKDELQQGQVLPPFSGIIRCIGNSFGPTSMTFIPIMTLNPSKNVVFAPCSINSSVYQTVELSNISDTPTYFRITPDVNKIFRVFPKAGLVEAKGFQILTIQFTPREYRTYSNNLIIHLNTSSGNPLQLHVSGICTAPQIKIQNDGKVFFPPSFTGVYSKQIIEIENLSKLPVTFSFDVPEKFVEQLYFNPSEGVLSGNEILKVETCFIPQSKKHYKIKVPIKISEKTNDVNPNVGYFNPGSINFTQTIQKSSNVEYLLEVIGQGSDGSLKLEKDQIDFEVVKVSEQKKLKVKLQNLSTCTFYVDLSLKQNKPDSKITSQQINSAFHLDFNEGIIAANSQILIGLTFTPIEVVEFDLLLVVNAKQKAPKTSKITPKATSVTKCNLRIRAHGSYPLLKIVDIRNDSISVAALWQNFQISKINQQFSQNLTGEQKKYLNIENLPYTEAQQLQNKLKAFQWNFGYVSSKTNFRPRKIIITVKNFGGTNLDYNFKFPSDNSIEEEIWADPGEPSKQQVYQKAILTKNIFQIKPRSDSLKPNDVRDIELIYTPSNLQSGQQNGNTNQKHYLTVVLQIKNGKPLVLNLKGMTLGPFQGLLTVKKSHYKLPNTPIGLLVPVKFPIQIQNVGSSKINYKTQIQYQDKQFTQVFTISNPNNSLLPSEKQYLYCQFKPLQKKKYNFKVIVNVYDFVKLTHSVEITLEGQGYEKLNQIQEKTYKNVEDIPGQRSLVSQIGSKVFFSIQEIDFGVLKPLQTSHRMIILYNLSKSTSLNFDFPTMMGSTNKSGLTCGDEFIIEPSSGELSPNNFIEIKITLTSANTPSVYEGEIQCNIVWGSKYNQQQKQIHTVISQKSAQLNFEKETLFLRIKKKSSFDIDQINEGRQKDLKQKSSTKNSSLFEELFHNIVDDVINSNQLIDDINKIYQLPLEPVDLIDQDQGVNIQKVDGNIQDAIMPQSSFNYTNYNSLFLNDEFLEMGNLIMQNTFFNIIQETTHKQNDLLRVTKKFVSLNKNE